VYTGIDMCVLFPPPPPPGNNLCYSDFDRQFMLGKKTTGKNTVIVFENEVLRRIFGPKRRK
jgi:hypothetical protein